MVVAGTHSGVGKTTVACGLMAALRQRGRRVAAAKVGPDFIDPGYHALACGRPGRNLDPWICGPTVVPGLAARAGDGADVLIVEGVMGLFDGAADGTPSSTADVAAMLEAPVILVVDCAAQAASVAALVHGFSTFDRRIRVAGVVLNRLASDGHERMVREAVAAMPRPLPVLGALRTDALLEWRDRHLGLVPVAEDPATVTQSLARLAAVVAQRCDLAAIEAIAAASPQVTVHPLPMPRAVASVRIAVAGGRAFTFAYPDNAEALVAAGAEIVPFDPLRDHHLPPHVDAMVVGGGFPEVMAAELSANTWLLEDVRRRIAAGLVVWAECGGLLWLSRSLDAHPMAGVVAADAVMTQRLTLGYREVTTCRETPFGAPGVRFRGHEFHYSALEPGGDALALSSRLASPQRAGFATPRLLASYVHAHLAGQPHLAEAFVARSAARPT